MEETNVHTTAFDLLKEEFDDNNKPVFTFSEPLDRILGGGVRLKSITEIYGAKGLGKTTFCLQLALNVQIPKSIEGLAGECLFIDTENTFVLQRLKTMATKFAEHCQAAIARTNSSTSTGAATPPRCTMDLESLLNGIHYFNCKSAKELEELLIDLDKYLTINPLIRLIIIDSLAFPFFSLSSDFNTRTKLLYTLAQELRRLMNKFNLAVVVTNSMTTRFGKFGQEYHIPYLGESWTFVPNRKIQLEWDGNCRIATLMKCSAFKSATARYRVIASGIRD